MSIADKLTTIADNQQKVYDTGYEKGNKAGYTEGYDSGQKSQYDEFWDAFQNYGKRVNYKAAFANVGEDFVKPKYDIIFDGSWSQQAEELFSRNRITGNFNEYFKNLGRIIDFSKVTSIHELFSNCSFSEITLYAPKATSGYGPFGWANSLETLTVTLSDNFAWLAFIEAAHKLTNFTLNSKITKKGFSASTNTLLTKESIISIINALSDTTTALTVTLSKTAVNNAFETAKGNADGSTSEEWAALIATKQNWTISLV